MWLGLIDSGSTARAPIGPRRRILHLIVSRRFAGSEQLMLTLAQVQRQAGHDVSVAIKPGGVLAERVRRAGFEPIPVALGRPWSGWRLARWLARNPVDVLHAHLSGAVKLAERLGRRCGVPVAAHAHVYKKRPAYARLARQGGLIAISRDIQRYYADYAGIESEQLALILNGVDPRFDPGRVRVGQRDQLREALGVGEQQHLLTLTGRLTRQKGGDLLIEAAARLHQQGWPIAVRLFGATHHDPAWARSLRQRIEQLQLQSVVRLAGFADDVPALMAASDIHVVPSRYEPFGLTAIEAMAMACPVVAAKVGGLAEIIDDGDNGLLFVPEDVDDLAGKLAGLMQSPALRQRLANQAAATVRARYSASAMAEAVEQVYRRLLEAG